METTTVAQTAGVPQRILEFQYDYLGRRVQKRVIDGATSLEISCRRLVYQGWNVIGEYAAAGGSSFGALIRTYTWGLDIARSLADAAGVGALMQISDHASGKSYLPAYDGNGNIVALSNAATGALAAIYEYTPFGESIRTEILDSALTDQPFRFSTKWTDDESGLVYYGRRYYDPRNGRFVGRDPIEEDGGLNLHGFCGNNAVNRWDRLGMDAFMTVTGTGIDQYGNSYNVWEEGDGPSWDQMASASAAAANNQSWTAYAEGVMAGALANADRAAMATLQQQIAAGNAVMTSTSSGGTQVITAGNQAIDAFQWVSAAYSDALGYNINSSSNNYFIGGSGGLFSSDSSGGLASNNISFVAAAFIPGGLGNAIVGLSGTWVDEPGTFNRDVATDNRSAGEFYISGSTSRLATVGNIPVSQIGNLGALASLGLLDDITGIYSSSSPSHVYSSGSGVQTATATAVQTLSARDTGPFSSVLVVTAAAGYPLLPSLITPDIDYRATISLSYDPSSSQVSYALSFQTNRFPAYEFYINRNMVVSVPPVGSGPNLINLNTSRDSSSSGIVPGPP